MAAGLRQSQIDHRLRHGRLEPLHRNVYRIGGTPPSSAQHLTAACLGAGPLAGGSHRAAVAVWGLEPAEEPPVEIIVPYAASPSLEGVVLHRSVDLLPSHVTTVDAVPVTTPVRTIADLGAVEPWWRVERVLEQFLVRRLTTIEEVRSFHARHHRRGRRGLGVLGKVLERRGLGDQMPHSVFESMVATTLRTYDVPEPVYQHRVVVDGRLRIIDFAYPEWLLAVEVLGFEPHSRREVFEDDCLRGNELALAGWTVLEFTWADVVDRSSYLAGAVRRALRRAGAPV